MRILITGATGSIGSRLVERLKSRGDELLVVSRDPGRAASLLGLPPNRVIDGDPTIPGSWQDAISGADAVVHLACAGLEEHTETAEDIDRLRERRLDAIFQVCIGIEQAGERPRDLVIASSMIGGIPEQEGGTITSIHRACEDEACKARGNGVRVKILRLGLLLDGDKRAFQAIAGAGPVDAPFHFVHVEDAAVMFESLLDETIPDGIHDGFCGEALALRDLKREVGKFTRRTPRGEIRTLIEGTSIESTRCPHSCRFDAFGKAMADLCRDAPARPGAVATKADPEPANAIVVLPCEGFLTSGLEVHPGGHRAVQILRDAGLTTLIATSAGGKLPLEIASRLGVTDPVIAADGTLLLDPGTGEAIRTESLGADRVSAIGSAVRTSEPRVSIIVERGVRVSSETEGVPPPSMRNLTSIDEVVSTQALFGRPATRILFHAPPRRLERAIEVIRSTWWRERLVAINQYASDVVAVTAPTGDRGVALQRAESVMGVRRGTSIVVAAGERDAGMLEFSELPFALSSLPAKLGSSARSVLASSDPVDVAESLVRAHLARSMRAATRAR